MFRYHLDFTVSLILHFGELSCKMAQGLASIVTMGGLAPYFQFPRSASRITYSVMSCAETLSLSLSDFIPCSLPLAFSTLATAPPTPRPLQVPFLLPGMFFPQDFVWLNPFQHSGFSSPVTSLERPSLTIHFKVAPMDCYHGTHFVLFLAPVIS